MERDFQSDVLVLDPRNLVLDSTGDDTSTGIDTKGARGVVFAVDLPSALTTQVTYLTIQESDDDGSADAYADVASEKLLPTELTVEHAASDYGQLLVNPSGSYKQLIGAFSTKRYVRLVGHTDTSQGSLTLSVIPILRMADKPTVQFWHPTVDGGDAQP